MTSNKRVIAGRLPASGRNTCTFLGEDRISLAFAEFRKEVWGAAWAACVSLWIAGGLYFSARSHPATVSPPDRMAGPGRRAGGRRAGSLGALPSAAVRGGPGDRFVRQMDRQIHDQELVADFSIPTC